MLKRLFALSLFFSVSFLSFAQDGIQLVDSIAQVNQTGFSISPRTQVPNNFNQSFKSVSYQNKFKTNSYPDPRLNFSPNLLSTFAGDINGDGFDDMLSSYDGRFISDERSEDKGDNTNKTLIFFGNESSNVQDTLIYSLLRPVGDLNADGYDDAVGRNLGNTLNYYFGSPQGYIIGGESFTDTLSNAITGFKDFNGDGYDDIFAYNGISAGTTFDVIFGGENPSEFVGKRFTNDKFSFFVSSSLEKDVITEVSFNQGTKTADLKTFQVNNDLSFEVVFNHSIPFFLLSGGLPPVQFRVIDINGDGLEEIYALNVIERPTSNINLIFNASTEGYRNFTQFSVSSPLAVLNPLGDIDGDGRTDYGRIRDGGLEIGYGPDVFYSQTPVLETEPLIEFETFEPELNVDNGQSDIRVYGIGDYNGDGLDDFNILISNDTLFGQRIYYGSAERILESTNDILYKTEDHSRLANYREAENLGDQNGDGFEDLALLFIDRTEIYFGGSFKQEPDLIIPSKSEFNNTIEVGDFNGNGYQDLLIQSANLTDDPNNLSGLQVRIDIYSGGSDLGSEPIQTITSDDVGGDDVRRGGYDLSNIGDFNHDGVDDFSLIYFGSGTASIYYGGEDILSEPGLVLDDFRSDFGIEGLLPLPFSLGFRTKKVGDINGDNIDDFVVADIRRSFESPVSDLRTLGAVLIFFGSEHNPGEISSREPDEVIILDEEIFDSYQSFGYYLAGGDFNGDDHNDLLIVARDSPRHLFTSEEIEGTDGVFIYHGGPDFDNKHDQLFGIPGQPLNHAELNQISRFSGQVVPVKDINGDNADEIIFTTDSFTGITTNAILVMGGEMINNDENPAIQFVAPNTSSGLGPFSNFVNFEYSTAVGDFDADGIPEIILHQDADNNYRNKPIYTYSIQNPEKESQTIEFSIVEQLPFTPEPISLEAIATSALSVDFEVLSGPATISDGDLILSGIGQVIILASQPGNEVFNKAPLVRKMVTVTKADQIITFNAIDDKTFGDEAFTLEADTDSGLDISYSLVSGPATLEGNLITIIGAGIITVSADQPGDDRYNAAVTVTQTIEVLKASQTITIDEIADKVFGDEPFAVTASSNVNLDLILAVTSGPATISDDMVTITGAGEIVITASQAGNDNYNEASANITVTVAKADQIITIDDITDKVFGDNPFAVTASSDSQLDITLTVTSGAATISDNMVTLTGTGEVVITASQAGNDNYNEASANTMFTVEKADQTIIFTAIGPKTIEDEAFAPDVTASSGLDIILEVVSGPATINEGLVSLAGTIGTVVLRATQPGDDNFNAATAVEQSFEVTLVTFIENDPILKDIKLYPNPTSDQVTISLKNMALHRFKSISLTGADGSVIKSITLSTNQDQITFDLSSVQEGLYLILIHSEKGVFTKKLMKQN